MFYGRSGDFSSAAMTLDIVSNGASAVGSVYAQPKRASVLWDAYLIKCKDEIDENTLGYLAPVVERQIKGRFNYEDKCTWNKVGELEVMLPVGNDGSPDWEYMSHEYIYSRERKTYGRNPLPTPWMRFKVGDLFNIRPTKNYGMVNAELFSHEGTNRVVANSAYDNGVIGYVGLDPTEKPQCVTFSDTTDANSIFAQDEPFVGYSHVQRMRAVVGSPNFHALQYFASVFRMRAMGMGFDYSKKFRRDVAEEIEVMLPATLAGEVDWGWMSRQMQSYIDSMRSVANVTVAVK